MGTVQYACGCQVSRDMFDGKVWNVTPCMAHRFLPEVQHQLEVLTKMLKRLSEHPE